MIDEPFGDEPAEVAERNLRVLEALLFASAEPLAPSDIAPYLGDGADVPVLLETLAERYRGHGINLVRRGDKWAFRTAADLALMLRREETESRQLSRAALEVLAIIAYHQPATRAEVEEVRGVQSGGGTFDVLLQTGWVRMRGRRRTPGRPVTYGTTDLFLEQFSLANLGDLPGAAEMKAAGLLDMGVPAGFEVPDPTRADDGDLLSMDDGDDAPEFAQDFVGGEEP